MRVVPASRVHWWGIGDVSVRPSKLDELYVFQEGYVEQSFEIGSILDGASHDLDETRPRHAGFAPLADLDVNNVTFRVTLTVRAHLGVRFRSDHLGVTCLSKLQ